MNDKWLLVLRPTISDNRGLALDYDGKQSRPSCATKGLLVTARSSSAVVAHRHSALATLSPSLPPLPPPSLIMATVVEEKPQETPQEEVAEEKAEEIPEEESPEEEEEAPAEEEGEEAPAEEEGEEAPAEEEGEEAPAEEEEEEEEEEVVDSKPEIEDSCKPKCVKQLLSLQACGQRIAEDEDGQKHCTGQYFDYWGCIDKCTAPKLFRKLK